LIENSGKKERRKFYTDEVKRVLKQQLEGGQGPDSTHP